MRDVSPIFDVNIQNLLETNHRDLIFESFFTEDVSARFVCKLVPGGLDLWDSLCEIVFYIDC